MKYRKLTLAAILTGACLILTGCELTQVSFDNPFNVDYPAHPQHVVHSKAFNNFQTYRKQLKKRKYITIPQFEQLMKHYNKVVVYNNKRLNLFYPHHVKQQASYELHVARKIMNSYQNWNVVDNNNGMEYYVTIYFDGINQATNYCLRHVLGDDQFEINEYWDREHYKTPIY